MKSVVAHETQTAGRGLVVLFATWVLLPLWLGFPRVLDDSRLDGAILGLVGAVSVVATLRNRLHLPPGSLLLLFGFGCGFLGLIGLPGSWVVSGLADRAPWLAGWALLTVAFSFPLQLQRAWKWIFLGSAIVAGYELLQLLGLDPLGLQPAPGLPPTPPLSSRAHAGEFLSVFLVAGASWFTFVVDKKHYAKWLSLFGPAALLAGYFDLLAARLAITAGLLLVAWKQRHKLAPILILIGLFAGGEWFRSVSAPPFTVRDSGESGLHAWASIEGRASMYQACASQAAQKPLGIGFGRFERDYPKWRPLEEQRLSSSNYENISSRRPKTPHSEPLLVLVELGWLGFLAVCLGVVMVLRIPGRNTWTYPALAALSVHILVRSPLSDNGPLLAFAVLLLASRSVGRSASAHSKSARSLGLGFLKFLPPPAKAIAQKVLPATCATLALLPAPSQFFGELAVAKRLPLNEIAEPAVLESAVQWRPWDSRAWGLLAVDYSRSQEQVEMVPTALVEALRFDPSDLFALTAYFKLEMNRGNEANALALLAVAESFSPEHPAIRANRTIYLRGKSDFYRLNGLDLLKAKAPGAAKELRLAQLLMAMAEIRDNEPDKARKALRAAALYSQNQRATIERLSRDRELSEAKVHSLLSLVMPELAVIIGLPQ